MNTHPTPTALKPYTPTHTAEGVRLTKSERRAINRKAYAKQQAKRAKQGVSVSLPVKTKSPKPKATKKPSKPKATKPVKAAKPKATKAAKPKATKPKASKHTSGKELRRKAGQVRPSSNDRMEARAQTDSLRKQLVRREREIAQMNLDFSVPMNQEAYLEEVCLSDCI